MEDIKRINNSEEDFDMFFESEKILYKKVFDRVYEVGILRTKKPSFYNKILLIIKEIDIKILTNKLIKKRFRRN